MFQQAWASNAFRLSPPPKPWEDALVNIDKAALHMWEEHCVECAPPDCYNSCKLFEPRADLKCARFVHGIVESIAAPGIEVKSHEIRFRRWAKLETKLPKLPKMWPLDEMLSKGKALNRTERMARSLANMLSPVDGHRKVQGAQYAWHQKVFPRRASADVAEDFDGFYMEIFSEGNASFTLELLGPKGIALRHALQLQTGWNRAFIDREQWPSVSGEGLLRLSNNLDEEVTLLISALHLVKWKNRTLAAEQLTSDAQPREQVLPKIKCVVFDLDNTLWEGVIGDDGKEGVFVRQEALDFIEDLDKRGIICAVASKNESGIALEKIQELGLSEHLLFPEINWGPKSQSLRRIAEAMNVSLNTFAFIDDNPFERREVLSSLPMVRVFSEQGLPALLNAPDFDVPITEQAAKRRLSYLAESKRARERTDHTDGADAFLRSCNMKLTVLDPREHADRCLEMVDRTNQFNISGRRYSMEEFQVLLESDVHWCWSVMDDYGDYGIVGYLRAVMTPQGLLIKDFVMSCRVAQKRVEECLFTHLSEVLSEGLPVTLDLFKTNRNDAIVGKLSEMGSVTTLNDRHLRVELDSKLMGSDVITLTRDSDV